MIRICRDKNGQGECKICKANGKWSLTWLSLLYTVDGMPGYYCYEHAKMIDMKKSPIDATF